MYLMGVTMACLENTEENHRQKERKRLRSKYRFMVIVSSKLLSSKFKIGSFV
jgi:hypothetical protein